MASFCAYIIRLFILSHEESILTHSKCVVIIHYYTKGKLSMHTKNLLMKSAIIQHQTTGIWHTQKSIY